MIFDEENKGDGASDSLMRELLEGPSPWKDGGSEADIPLGIGAEDLQL